MGCERQKGAGMTNEDAIEVLKNGYMMEIMSDEAQEAIDVAIKALSAEPCEDCISRAEAIDALGYDISIESDEGLDAYKTVIKEMLCKIYDVQKENIEKLPSIQSKPKTGHWIEKDGFDGDTYYDCSECGESWTTIEGTPWNNGMNYCPNCGARMSESKYVAEWAESFAQGLRQGLQDGFAESEGI
jgi:DNA-directed RNA polymerase subunit RPC12/RpoP